MKHHPIGRGLVLSGLALFIAACSAGSVSGPRPSIVGATYEGTRIAAGYCIFGRAEGESALLTGLAAAIIPSLIEEGFSMVGRFLTEAGKESIDKSPVSATNVLAGPTGLPPCVQVVRGRFYAAAADATAAPAWASQMGLDATAVTNLRNARLHLAEAPEFLFEGFLAHAQGTDFATVIPRYVALNRPMNVPALNFDNARSVALALDIHRPDAGGEAGPAASIAIPLGRLTTGMAICFDPLSGTARGPQGHCRAMAAAGPSLPPTPSPGASSTAPGAFSGLDPAVGGAGASDPPRPTSVWSDPGRPFESNWFTMPRAAQPTPLTIRAVVTEVRSGSEFAAFLGTVFEGARPALTTLASNAALDATSSERREASARRRAEAAETAGSDYLTQLNEALTRLTACIEAPADRPAALLVAALAARQAQEKTNRLARDAGRRPPFVTMVPEHGTAAAREGCRQAVAQAVNPA